jgi:ribosomal protein S18 acetylase RimI-like enzyme
VTIRASQSGDIASLARAHVQAFQGFFLTSLGEPFLRELYRGFASDANAICLQAEDDDGLSGFVIGTTAPRGFFRRLLVRRWFVFCVLGIPGLLRHPVKVARKFLGALRYRGDEPEHLPGGALLSSLAVLPRCAGRGVGSALVSVFCDEAARRGSKLVYLTTDRDGNDRVNQFYVRAGFRLDSQFQNHGRWMNRYVKLCQG